MEQHRTSPHEELHAARRAVGDLGREERARDAVGIRAAGDGSVRQGGRPSSIARSAKRCRRPNAVDFDDLLRAARCACSSTIPTSSRSIGSAFSYILVDEYQDTNRAQYELIKLLGGGHGNVCVVGDDDQSIYGWRGADIRNILDFNKDFPNATVVRLEENYRSTPQILALANVVISANTQRMGKTLRATHAVQGRDHRRASLDERDEAEFVVGEMMAATIGGQRRCGSTTSPCCIARTRRVARWKKFCGATRCRIVSSAPCAFTIAARFAIWWRISS